MARGSKTKLAKYTGPTNKFLTNNKLYKIEVMGLFPKICLVYNLVNNDLILSHLTRFFEEIPDSNLTNILYK